MPPGAAPGLPACYGKIWRFPGPAMLCKGASYYNTESVCSYCKRGEATLSVRIIILVHQLLQVRRVIRSKTIAPRECVTTGRYKVGGWVRRELGHRRERVTDDLALDPKLRGQRRPDRLHLLRDRLVLLLLFGFRRLREGIRGRRALV